MQKISQLLAPALVGVVKEKSTLGAIAEMQNSVYDGATMIDLHLPCLENTEEGELKKIIDAARVPVLALYYPTGKDVPCEEERVEALLRAVRAGAAGIDMQGYTYHLPSKTEFCGKDCYSFTKGNPREIVTDSAIIEKQCALINEVHSMGAEVLLSCHPGIAMPCDAVVDLAAFLEKRPHKPFQGK